MRELLDEVTCLHCWAKFQPEDALWRSEHPDLLGDPLLGADAQLRFLPTRFNLDGNALDARGLVCRDLACPKCHLPVPRSLLERRPLFVSILGTPSCGKSYYLGALATMLRRELPSCFRLAFTDADMVSNQALTRYEDHLFLNEQAEQRLPLSTLIPKTQLHGDLYRTVRYGEQVVTYPVPFSFLLEPLNSHPNHGKSSALQQIVSLYDNAGEHFLPGQDSVSAPGTRHLAESSFFLFLFDPTQDPRWHAAMARVGAIRRIPRTQHAGRQEGVLREAAARVRALLGLADGVRCNRPLLIVLSKADLWEQMLPSRDFANPFVKTQLGIAAIDLGHVSEQSNCLRLLLEEYIPEIVYTADQLFDEVHYMCASALGTSPDFDENGQAYIRPVDICPRGVTLPFLLGVSLSTRGLIQKVRTENRSVM